MSSSVGPWLGIKCQDQGIGSWPITGENTALFIMGARVVPFLPTDLHGGLVHVGVCRRGLSVRKEVSEKPGSGASATVLPVVEEQRKSGKTSGLLGKTRRVMGDKDAPHLCVVASVVRSLFVRLRLGKV